MTDSQHYHINCQTTPHKMLFSLDPPAMSSLSCLILFREVLTATLALVHFVLGGAWGSSACLLSHCFRPTFIKECEQRHLISWKCWTELGRKWKTKRRRPSRKSSGCSACEPINIWCAGDVQGDVCVRDCLPACLVCTSRHSLKGCLMSFPLAGISGLSVGSTFLSPLLFVCLVLLFSLSVSCPFMCWWPIV